MALKDALDYVKKRRLRKNPRWSTGELPNEGAHRYYEARAISIRDAIKRYSDRTDYQPIMWVNKENEITFDNEELVGEPFQLNSRQMDIIDTMEQGTFHLRSRGGGKSFNLIEKIIQRKFRCKDCELYHGCKNSLRSEFSNIICPCFSMNKRIITEIHLADQKIEETKIDTHPRHTIQMTYNKFGEIVDKLEIIL